MGIVTTPAWCAGLYDGEGSTGCYILRDHQLGRLSMVIGQKDREVLRRFRSCVKLGKVTDRYPNVIGKTQYAWATYRPSEILAVGELIWPWLGTIKRRQYVDACRRYSALRGGWAGNHHPFYDQDFPEVSQPSEI